MHAVSGEDSPFSLNSDIFDYVTTIFVFLVELVVELKLFNVARNILKILRFAVD